MLLREAERVVRQAGKAGLCSLFLPGMQTCPLPGLCALLWAHPKHTAMAPTCASCAGIRRCRVPGKCTAGITARCTQPVLWLIEGFDSALIVTRPVSFG